CGRARPSPPTRWRRARRWSPRAGAGDVAASAAPRPGIAGRLAGAFQANPLTPVLALLGLLLGVVALAITPREEEPQIDVTMANVIVPFPGADARQVEQMVAYPLEQVLSEIEGVEHTYSVSRPGKVVATVEFEVGVERQAALVRLYDKVFSHQDWMPQGLGVGQPLIRPKGIDDVPVMALTLWTDDGERGARALVVELDPVRLASHGLAVEDLSAALQAANLALQAGERVGADGVVQVTAGRFLAGREEVESLVLGVRGGEPVRLGDVARITDG